MLPRQRPPVLRRLDLRRARDSKVEHPQRRVHHASRAKSKKAKPDGMPPEFDLLALLFKAFEPEGAILPPHIPYQPGKSWNAQ